MIKTALITGASSGFGKACAIKFAEHGYHIIACARRMAHLEALKADLEQSYGISVHPIQLDVRNKNAVDHAINSLPETYSTIDVLINNAGLAAGLSGFADADMDDWESMIDTNVKGLLYVTRAVLPRIPHKTGYIINIGSIAGHDVYPNGNVYCATKHAVRALNQAMRCDLLGTGIRVTSIDPGMAETEFSIVRLKDKQKAKAVYAGMRPLQAKDIADTAFFCVSRPNHVNISELVIYPTDQAAPGLVDRNSA